MNAEQDHYLGVTELIAAVEEVFKPVDILDRIQALKALGKEWLHFAEVNGIGDAESLKTGV